MMIDKREEYEIMKIGLTVNILRAAIPSKVAAAIIRTEQFEPIA